ncbi:MAG TPA: aquaporin [Candidatus Saccharimonadales bacterium]|nr:aquaporin [Candidatus Saccharimonadales bacterium]
MATKKAASTSKKSTAKKAAAKKQTSTKVTTVKAVESRPVAVAEATQKKTFKLDIGRRPLIAALIAEFIGTFIFAAAIIAGQGQPILVFFALVGVVLAIGTMSGAYVNPALTIAAWVTRRIGAWRALGYVVAQVLGAMLALVILNAYMSNTTAANPNQLYSAGAELFKAAALPEGKQWLVLMSEVLGTAIFGFAVAAATREIKERTAAAFTVGLGVYLGLMIAGSAAALISASAILNPAVAVALQVNFGNVWSWAVYILGSILGAVIGFALYDLLRNNSRENA